MNWNDPDLHHMASDFFRTFARMEYALKATSFLVPHRRNAEADWKAFAAEIQPALEQADEEVRRAVAFILAEPPRKQINVNGRIEWDNTQPDADHEAELVLRYICRIRNNLFHGGKFNGHWFQPERSGQLMQSALVVLNHCREACPNVAQAYRA